MFKFCVIKKRITYIITIRYDDSGRDATHWGFSRQLVSKLPFNNNLTEDQNSTLYHCGRAIHTFIHTFVHRYFHQILKLDNRHLTKFEKNIEIWYLIIKRFKLSVQWNSCETINIFGSFILVVSITILGCVFLNDQETRQTVSNL